jgi:hypothetical protein
MTVIINPYKRGSRGAKSLKAALVARGMKGVFIGKKAPKDPRALLVSWGNSEFEFPVERYSRIVNHPSVLGVMTNKLDFFRHVGASRSVPEWSTDAKVALDWKGKFLIRHRLEASGGVGIEVYTDDMRIQGITVPKAPLYVKYENKTHEFRLHMARSLRGDDFAPILVQRKIFQKSADMPRPKSWEVRNHTNGFVFVRESGYPTPQVVVDTAKEFMTKHFPRMHFCALDVIYHDKKNKAWVLEGNTAPGLEGNTVDVYANYIAGLAGQ